MFPSQFKSNKCEMTSPRPGLRLERSRVVSFQEGSSLRRVVHRFVGMGETNGVDRRGLGRCFQGKQVFPAESIEPIR